MLYAAVSGDHVTISSFWAQKWMLQGWCKSFRQPMFTTNVHNECSQPMSETQQPIDQSELSMNNISTQYFVPKTVAFPLPYTWPPVDLWCEHLYWRPFFTCEHWAWHVKIDVHIKILRNLTSSGPKGTLTLFSWMTFQRDILCPKLLLWTSLLTMWTSFCYVWTFGLTCQKWCSQRYVKQKLVMFITISA